MGIGRLDVLVHGTLKDQTRATACVEFKFAHSADLEHGLVAQLPEYMRLNRCDLGIYVVLSFKCANFDRPLETAPYTLLRLEAARREAGLDAIRIMHIDLAPPLAPSKATALV